MAIPQNTSIPRHRTSKGAQRIQELITVAAELFLERGFESVAVDDLIARVGGSRRNVYSHFGGKEGLFIAAMTQMCEEIAVPLERLIIEQRDPRAALSSFGRQLLQVILAPRTLALHRLMVAEGKRFPQLAQAIYNAGPRKVIDALAKWIEARRREPQRVITSELPATVLAQHFINQVVSHVQLRVLVGLDPLPLPEAEIELLTDNAVATFLHGIQTERIRHEYD